MPYGLHYTYLFFLLYTMNSRVVFLNVIQINQFMGITLQSCFPLKVCFNSDVVVKLPF